MNVTVETEDGSTNHNRNVIDVERVSDTLRLTVVVPDGEGRTVIRTFDGGTVTRVTE